MFVDTWAWVAMAVADDPDHHGARTGYADLVRSGARPVTSRFVIAETLTRLRYDVSHTSAVAAADAIHAMVDAELLAVAEVDAPLWQSALAWFRRFDDQRFSFVDCTSFAIMEARGLTDALTADRHFATAGFTPLGAV